jgi:hypothetical protein
MRLVEALREKAHPWLPAYWAPVLADAPKQNLHQLLVVPPPQQLEEAPLEGQVLVSSVEALKRKAHAWL